MSRLGSTIAFGAEAGIWIAGAALIASAAGMHWNVDLPKVDLSGLVPARSAAVASGTPAVASGTPAVATLAPSPSPSMSPTIQKFLVWMSSPSVQYKATIDMTMSFVLQGSSYQMKGSGTLLQKGNDQSESLRMTFNGQVTSNDSISLGTYKYTRTDGGKWTKAARPASDKSSALPSADYQITDKGADTMNGVPIHRLEIGPQEVVNAALGEGLSSGISQPEVTMVFLVTDDGTLAGVEFAGKMNMTIQQTTTVAQLKMTYTVTATSGVTITAPI